MAENAVGQFIFQLRKEKKITQKELASQLHITDKAVSKWERGLSYPDISLLNSLSEILGVTTSELLNGQRSEECAGDVKASVDNALVYAEETAKGRIAYFRNIWAIAFSLFMLLSITVCVVCDIVISGKITWSRYPVSSILFAWLVLIPLVKSGKKGVFCSLAVLSLSILPFLYVLDQWIGSVSILPIGIFTSLLSVLYLWCVYFIFQKMKRRKWLAGGISLLLSIPLCLALNVGVAKVLGQPWIDGWDIMSVIILFIGAILLFLVDFSASRRT